MWIYFIYLDLIHVHSAWSNSLRIKLNKNYTIGNNLLD